MSKTVRLLTRQISLAVALFLGGCANFNFNTQMCDAHGPNAQNLPQECYSYSEEAAGKSVKVSEEIPCNECSKSKVLELEK